MNGEYHIWLPVLRRYLVFSAGAHLVWELAQMPLYTLWYVASAGQIVYAALHCTAGDVLIAGASLLLAWILCSAAPGFWAGWPKVALLAVIIGLVYTIFSEWLNTEIRGSWAYAEIMPVVPVIGAGLSPLLQWIIVPSLGLVWAMRPLRHVGKA